MEKEIKNILQDARLGLVLGVALEEAVRQVGVFLAEWAKWNAKIDLTAETEALEVLRRHLFDSLLYQRGLISPRAERGSLVDVGSGGGFPGIPLKIVQPELALVLVESQRKRAGFLRSVTAQLGWRDVEIHQARAEELAANPAFRNRFDQATFRAVGPLASCLEWGAGLIRPGGRMIIMKEPGAEPQGRVSDAIELAEEIPVENYYGRPSKLMVFQKKEDPL